MYDIVFWTPFIYFAVHFPDEKFFFEPSINIDCIFRLNTSVDIFAQHLFNYFGWVATIILFWIPIWTNQFFVFFILVDHAIQNIWFIIDLCKKMKWHKFPSEIELLQSNFLDINSRWLFSTIKTNSFDNEVSDQQGKQSANDKATKTCVIYFWLFIMIKQLNCVMLHQLHSTQLFLKPNEYIINIATTRLIWFDVWLNSKTFSPWFLLFFFFVYFKVFFVFDQHLF